MLSEGERPSRNTPTLLGSLYCSRKCLPSNNLAGAAVATLTNARSFDFAERSASGSLGSAQDDTYRYCLLCRPCYFRLHPAQLAHNVAHERFGVAKQHERFA